MTLSYQTSPLICKNNQTMTLLLKDIYNSTLKGSKNVLHLQCSSETEHSAFLFQRRVAYGATAVAAG